jgi:hypothetical protein
VPRDVAAVEQQRPGAAQHDDGVALQQIAHRQRVDRLTTACGRICATELFFSPLGERL